WASSGSTSPASTMRSRPARGSSWPGWRHIRLASPGRRQARLGSPGRRHPPSPIRAPMPAREAGCVTLGGVARSAVAGGLSALTHIGTLTLLVETGLAAPVLASTIGFVLSIVVSYTLQKLWVFSSTARHRTTLPRFLAATTVAML